MASSKSTQSKSKPGRDLEVPALRVTEPVHDCFTAAVDCHNYRLLRNLSRNGDDVAYEPHRIGKKTAVQMKDRLFSRKDAISIIDFLQDFKSSCDSRRIHEGTAMELSKQFLTALDNVTVKVRVKLSNSARF